MDRHLGALNFMLDYSGSIGLRGGLWNSMCLLLALVLYILFFFTALTRPLLRWDLLLAVELKPLVPAYVVHSDSIS